MVASESFAQAHEKIDRDEDYHGYQNIPWLHEIPLQSQFADGVHLVVLSRSLAFTKLRSFAVDLQKASFIGGWKKWGASALGSTGHKGAAVVQLGFEHDGQERTICFAGSHLDASSESTRVTQTDKVTQALQTIECPDGAWWAGDFNPRLKKGDQCCPWDRLELLMHHGRKEAVVDLVRSMDPIIHGTSWRTYQHENASEAAPFVMPHWQCQGKSCSAGWHELPIGFAPTFHKLYDRQARTSSEGTCHFNSHKVSKIALADTHGPIPESKLGQELQTLNNENQANIPSWSPHNSGGSCASSGRHQICWDGAYSKKGCKEQGACYHTHKDGHCPLFTDRILFARGLKSTGPDFRDLAVNSPYPMVIGCRYEAFPEISTADHAPVVASFSVTFGEGASR